MPVLSNIKLGLLRYNTKIYIMEDPTWIIFQRKTKVRKAGGGHDKVPMPIPAQVFRFINQGTGPGVQVTGEGDDVRRAPYVLLGLYNADVDVDDSWVDGDIQYRVDGVVPNNNYETRIHVTAFAKEPTHG